MISSEFIKDLQEEFEEAPTFVKPNEGFEHEEDDEDRRRRVYEENYMKRLPMTKEYRKKLKERKMKMEQKNKIDDFSEFDQIRNALKEERASKSMQLAEDDEKFKKSVASHLKRRTNLQQGRDSL